MFTAMQSAHLDRAVALHEARTKLFGCINLICNDVADRQHIYTAIEAVDLMLAKSVPNSEGPLEPKARYTRPRGNPPHED